jgi:hypothetical protein
MRRTIRDPHHLGASSVDDHASIHHRRQAQTSIFFPIKAATDLFAANILPISPFMRVERGCGRNRIEFVRGAKRDRLHRAVGRKAGVRAERTMMSKVRLETDGLAATARRAASLMFNEHDLSEADALARAGALICEMPVGWAGGDMNVRAEVIAMLLNSSAEATTATDFLARLTPPPLSTSSEQRPYSR